MSWEPEKGRVAAAQDRYRTNASVTRELGIEGAQFKDIVRVATSDNRDHTLALLLQLQGKVQLPPSARAAQSFAETHPSPGFKHWREVTRSEGKSGFQLLTRYGDKTLRVKILRPESFVIYHANVPDSPPRRREALMIETTGREATFETVAEFVE